MRITDDTTIGVIVDIQEKLLPFITGAETIVPATVRLIRGLQLVGVPVVYTEQYPKGLGPTVPDIIAELPLLDPMIKSSFSCCDDDPFREALTQSGKKTVLLAGIEAHVCMLQTAVDLVELGYNPVVIADCTGSRSPFDRDIAFGRMRHEGIRISTVESVLFELTRYSGTPRFKEISRLVK